jgi:autotransporter-associated beta strand protein
VSSGNASILVPEPFGSNNNAQTISASITLNDPLTIDNSTAAVGKDLTLSGVISGTGSITKTGAAQVVFSGTTANTYSGTTTVSAGTLQLSKTAGVKAIGGNLNVSGGTALLINSNQILDSKSVTVVSGTFDIDGKTEAVAGVQLIGGSISGSGAGSLTSASDYDVQAGSISAVLAGTVGLTKTTNGIVSLSGVNTLTGKTTITGGVLSISAETGLGGNPAGFTADQLTLNGGTLRTTASVVIDDANRGITLGISGGTISVTIGNSSSLSSANVITGSGSLTKAGAGNLVLGAVNTYNGNTTVSAGGLGLGVSDAIPDGPGKGNVTVNSGSTLMLVGNVSDTINGLSGSGMVDTSTINSTATLSVGGNNASSAFGGVIQNSAAGSTLNLVKTGGGKLTLSGANTYSGNTQINDGTVTLTNAGSLTPSSGSPIVFVNTNGILAGKGTINEAVVVNGGTVGPGTSPGKLTVGSADFSSGGVLMIQVPNFGIAGTDYDQLVVIGALTLGGSSALQLDLNGLSNDGTAAGIVTYGTRIGFFSTVTLLNNLTYSFLATPTYGVTSLDYTFDAPLTITSLTPPIAAEGIATGSVVVAHFTDANPTPDIAKYTATISWGDGNITIANSANGGIVANLGGGFNVLGNHTYSEEFTGHTFTVVVADSDGATATASNNNFNVSDPAVVLNASPITVPAIGEGQSTATVVVATFTDPGGAEVVGNYTAMIDWGDGTPVSIGTISYDGGTQLFSVSGIHTYAEESSNSDHGVGNIGGVFQITSSITHEAAPLTSGVTAIIIVNDLSVSAIAVNLTANEGAAFTDMAVATFTDPGGAEGLDAYSATINWGDGSAPTIGTISFSGGTFTVKGGHTYVEESSANHAGSNSYQVTVTISHESSTDTVVTSTATVSDPSVLATPTNFTAREGLAFSGKTVATFTDPAGAESVSDYSAMIDWGDGSAPTIGTISFSGGTFTVKGGHTYVEESSANHAGSNPYQVTVTISHESSIDTVVTSTATVSDPAVDATAVNFNAVEGLSFTKVVATFTDPGGAEDLSDYSATIDWGDGTPLDVGIIGVGFTVTGTHTYAEESDADHLGSAPYQVVVTVLHESAPDTVVMAEVTVSDPAVLATAVNFIATRGVPLVGQMVATFTDPGGAEALGDYNALIDWGDGSAPMIGTISFSGGTFTVTGDHTYAAGPNCPVPQPNALLPVTVTITHESAPLTVVTGQATVVDAQISVTVSPATVLEDGQQPLTYKFHRDAVVDEMTVFLSVSGTANYVVDYTQENAFRFNGSMGQFMFGFGQSDYVIELFPVADTNVEVDETAILTVMPGFDYLPAPANNSATGKIQEDDFVPDISVAVSPGSAQEDGTTNLVFTFTRTAVQSALQLCTDPMIVRFTVGGSATFDTDYTPSGARTFNGSSGTVSFGFGQLTATIVVDPTADNLVESNEDVILTVVGGANYNVGLGNVATGMIVNDDFTPNVSVAVSPSSVLENGQQNLIYTFTRTQTANPLTVNFTIGGSASFGSDYAQSGAQSFNGSTGTITFGSGQTTATVTVDPNADSMIEGDETVVLTVASGTGYSIVGPAATGTITNDDFLPTVTLAVAPASVVENGTSTLIYTFTRTGSIANSSLLVNFNVGGSAGYLSDYTQSGAKSFSGSSGSVSFGFGQSTATVVVDPKSDSVLEPDETVLLTLASSPNYTVGTVGPVTGTILNDDIEVSLAVAPGSVTEDGGSNLIYTFSRVGSMTNPLTVKFAVGGAAKFGTDYTQSGASTFGGGKGTVVIPALASSATVTIDPIADSTIEANEAVKLTVTTSTGSYVIGAANMAIGTITNDYFPIPPSVSLGVSPASVLENGNQVLRYTFTRTTATTPLTANFNVGGTATFKTDYAQSGAATFVGGGAGSVTFGSGQLTATVMIDPNGDTTPELDETVILTLASGLGYTLGTQTIATGKILNDDGPLSPIVSIAVLPSAVTESGTNSLVYSFTRSATNSDPLTIHFTVGGTATYIADYTQSGASSFNGSSGTVTFGFGQSTVQISIDPHNDGTPESTEDIILSIIGGLGYTVGGNSVATGMILDI